MKTTYIFLILGLMSFICIHAQETTKTTEEEIIEDKVVEKEDKLTDEVPFVVIDEVPVFPGCNGSEHEKRECLNMSVQKHVAKNFRLRIAKNLGLSPGKKRIYAQFRITKTGDTEIIGIRAPHKKLKKETIRVVKKLPKMVPGRQRNIAVNVTYMLPISFLVE